MTSAIRFQDNALAFCRERCFPLFDAQSNFLGTGTRISGEYYLTCRHLRHSGPIIFSSPELDIEIFKNLHEENSNFTSSTKPIKLGQRVLIYGFRESSGLVDDILIHSSVNSFQYMTLGDQSGVKCRVVGLGDARIIERGMSGGAVLDGETGFLIGYILGYHHTSRDIAVDVFIPVTEVLESSAVASENFEIDTAVRANAVSALKKFLALQGFYVQSRRLGSANPFTDVVVAAFGSGKFTMSIGILTVDEHSFGGGRDIFSVADSADALLHAKGIQVDRVLLLNISSLDREYLDSPNVVTFSDLRRAVPKPIGPDESMIDVQWIDRTTWSPEREVLDATTQQRLSEETFFERLLVTSGLVFFGGDDQTGKEDLLKKKITLLGSLDWLPPTPDEFPHRFALGDLTLSIMEWPGVQRLQEFFILNGFDDVLHMDGTRSTIEAVQKINEVLWKYRGVHTLIVPTMVDDMDLKLAAVSSLLPAPMILNILPLDFSSVEKEVSRILDARLAKKCLAFISHSHELIDMVRTTRGLRAVLGYILRKQAFRTEISFFELLTEIVEERIERTSSELRSLDNDDLYGLVLAVAKHLNSLRASSLSAGEFSTLIREVITSARARQSIIARKYLLKQAGLDIRNDGSVRFEAPYLFHYFLAIAVAEAIHSIDNTQRNPMYHRRLPIGVLREVERLGVSQACLLELLDGEAARTSRSYIGGNAISLLRIGGYDFRGKDLSGKWLKGAIFSGSDLSGSNFANANLSDAGFAGCKLDNCDFAYADLDKADLKSGGTIYELCSAKSVIYAGTSTAGLVRLLTADNALHPNGELEGLLDSVFTIDVSPELDLVAGAGQDGLILLWRQSAGTVQKILRGHFGDIRSVRFCRNRLFSAGVDGQIICWDLISGKPLSRREIRDNELWDISPIQTGQLAVLSRTSMFYVLESSSLEVVKQVQLPDGLAHRLKHSRTHPEELLVGGVGVLSSINTKTLQITNYDTPEITIRSLCCLRGGAVALGSSTGDLIIGHFGNGNILISDIHKIDEDYVSAIEETDEGMLIVGTSSGRLISGQASEATTRFQARDQMRLGDTSAATAQNADFSKALNIPTERRKTLQLRGAIV